MNPEARESALMKKAETILQQALRLGADDAMRMAAQRAIPLIEKSAAIYTEQRDCFSCHHQALTVMTLSRAKLAGLPVRDDAISGQSKFTLEYFSDRKDRLP